MDAKDLLIEKQAVEIKTLKETIMWLKEEIDRLKKDSNNSSKPPSSDIVKPSKILRRLGKKRKRGGQHGHHKFSRQPFEPEQVDEVIEYELRDKDAKGLKPLDEWYIVQQVRLPIDIGMPSRAFPVTPPGIRIRTTAVRLVKLFPVLPIKQEPKS